MGFFQRVFMFDPKAQRLFFDLLSDAVLVLDRGARIYFANTTALRLLYVEAGSSTLADLKPLLGQTLVEGVTQILARGMLRLEKLHPTPLPEEIALPDGRRYSVALSPIESDRWALRLAALAQGMNLPVGPKPRPAPGDPASMSVALVGLVWGSPFPTFLMNEQFRIVEVNQAYADFTGRDPSQLIGHDPIDFQPENDRRQSLAYRRRQDQATPGSPPEQMAERRLVHADGRERWFRTTWRAWTDPQGHRCFLSILQDSTAEHTARERADHSARELDDWFDLSPVGMVLFDHHGLMVRSNPAFEALAGQAPVLISEADPGVQRLLGWHDGKPMPELEPGARPVQLRDWISPPGGDPRHLRSIVRCYRTAAKQLRFMAVVEDCSAEDERDLAQVQIGALMETAGVGLATFQESSGWVQRGGSLAGAAQDMPASAASLSIRRDLVVRESLPEYERLQEALRNTERVEVRYAIRHPDLGQRWLLTRVEPATLASGKRTTSVVTLDVTEQHRAQHRSDMLLRELTTILESTTAGIAYFRGSVLARCNSRFESLLGFSAGKVAGSAMYELFARQPHVNMLVTDIDAALDSGAVYETEIAIDLPHQPRRWCSLTVRRAGPGGDASESIAVLSDITRLKAQQMELEALVRDRELMFSLSEVGIAFIRKDCIQRANQAMCQLTGYDPSDWGELPVNTLFPDPDDFPRMRTAMESDLRRHGSWTGERQIKRRDGSLLWVQISMRPVLEDDPQSGLIASYVNVDDRHRAQETVALQAERTRAILDSVLVGIVTVGPKGIEWMNRSARRMFGGDLTEFIDRPMSIAATEGDGHPFRQTHYLQELVEGEAETFECKVKALDGREFWVVGNAVATGRELPGRQLTYALLDIEQRRQAEALMAQVKASLQRVIEAAPLAITLFDAESLRILQVNQLAARSAGRTPEDMVGRTPEATYPPEQAAQRRADMLHALAARDVTQRDYRVESGGEICQWDARYLPLASEGAPPDQLLLVATDVTEQRAAQEARLEAAIAQRDMLVKEVHHRIKNNLQGVAGLLAQISLRKPDMAPALNEAVSQVQAIAQVYGLQVGVAGPLRVRSVLEAITGSVQRTFGMPIEMSVEGAHSHIWALPEAESIPIALTVNELLSNAIKHSQAGSGRQSVGCRLVCHDDAVHIVIANAGELPAGFNLARFPGGVSGLGLVRALLPRRSAKLTIDQQGSDVVATIALVSPGVMRLEPA